VAFEPEVDHEVLCQMQRYLRERIREQVDVTVLPYLIIASDK